MTWCRQIRIAEEALSLRVHGFSPETEARLSRKYQPFVIEEPFPDGVLIEIQRKADLADIPAPELPIFVSEEGIILRSRGIEALWNGATIRADVANDLAHPIENVIRFALTRSLLAAGAGFFHAAAVENARGDGAFVVMGESEAGKTTLATIFGRERTLSDEMPALRKAEGVWQVHATPFWGDMTHGETNGSRVLQAIFILQGKGELAIKALSAPEAQQALLARVFNYSAEAEALQQSASLAQALVADTPIFSLSYPKDTDLATLEAALAGALEG